MAEISGDTIRPARVRLTEESSPLIQVGLGAGPAAGTVFLRFSRPVGAVWLTRAEATRMIDSLTKYRDQILEK